MSYKYPRFQMFCSKHKDKQLIRRKRYAYCDKCLFEIGQIRKGIRFDDYGACRPRIKADRLAHDTA